MKNVNTLLLGKSGEDAATDFLNSFGYKIITRNFHSQFGEIDIIAMNKDTLVFIEVKTRSSNLTSALNSISVSKQKKLSKTASLFLSKNPQSEDSFTRFDVIIILKKHTSEKIKHLKDAFTPIL